MISNYKAVPITTEDLEIYVKTPQEDEDESRALDIALECDSSKVVILERFIREYPHNPWFRRVLHIFYTECKQHKKAEQAIEECVRLFPNYLDGRIALAKIYFANNKYDEMSFPLSGGKMIHEYNLDRETYPVKGVMDYQYLLGFYWAYMGNMKEGYELVDKTDAIAERYQVKDNVLQKLIRMQMMRLNMQNFFKKQERGNAVLETVITESWKEASEAKIIFVHPEEIEKLYQHSYDIPFEYLEAILALPRQSVIQDLITVIYDSYQQWESGATEDWEWETHWYLNHAFSLLGALKAKEALPTILHTLRLEDDYLDYWFSDSQEEIFLPILIQLGQDDLSTLYSFVLEEKRNPFHQDYVSQALLAIAFIQEEKKEEILLFFENFLRNAVERNDFSNSSFLSYLAGNISYIEFAKPSIMELLQELFQQDKIDTFYIGLEDVQVNTKKSCKKEYSYELDLKKRYAKELEEWSKVRNRNDNEPKDKPKNDNLFKEFLGESFEDQSYSSTEPFIQTKTVGRNDPCTCGSGKKYKKCCGK